ncbi:MAG: ABC transporter ATP-binding protein, partial [Desulfuromusa sp.]|nr:ABC transporter ATP-binding protein [Desulfuromusa sp.]
IEKSYKLYQSPLARLKEALHPRKKRYYENFYALKGVDLEILKGETWGIIGLNGSGKSTLLKIICGVIQPDCGELQVNGRIAALLELGSGFNPEYTGRQNVFFAGALADVGRAEMEGLFPEIEGFAAIGDFIDQPVKSYSSGMLMRLAFAVAVNVAPDILVVDEALAVGDARFQHKCMKKIKSFQGRSTMLLVTHDMTAVLTLCDSVAWLHEGNLVAVGEPKKIVDRYTQAVYEGGASAEQAKVLSKPEVESIAAVEIADDVTDFGKRGATITKVAFFSQERGAIDAVYGGEEVTFQFWFKAATGLEKPIVGLLVKNRLGIEIFGFNSITLNTELSVVGSGESCRVDFNFVWPKIAAGNYAISIAVADGDLESLNMHHWINDVLVVEVLLAQEHQIGMLAVDWAQVNMNSVEMLKQSV